MKIKFDDKFLFGCATSGPQTEGWVNKNNDNIMDYWFKNNPDDFFDGIGPNITNNMYCNFEEDIQLMNKIGINSFRTSIQWTRIIKDFNTYEICYENVKYYRNYFSKLKKNNIKVIVNLYHFDMPKIFQDIGGFENSYVIEKFVEYAKICFKEFNDIVDLWATFNEPIVPVEGCYLYKWYYPKITDFKRAIQFGYGTLLAHAKVVNVFHEMFIKDKNKKITIILNLTPSYPKNDNPLNLKATECRDLLFNKSFLDPIVKNEFPKKLINMLAKQNLLPKYNHFEIEQIKKSYIDFLCVNYYQPSRVEHNNENEITKIMPEIWFKNYEWKERRVNKDRGWEIYPKALFDIGMEIKNNYNNIPWIVSENGIGIFNENRYRNSDGYIDDKYRIEFIKEHLYWLKKAIDKGSNCFGYHLWTFIDCWSWANSYKNRYGIIELDLKNQNRIIKKSGYWFKEIIETKEFEIEGEKYE